MMLKYYICSMLTLNPHIKELLMLYDCVILPGFGGFVSADRSARFDADNNRFIAPAKEISFNKNLKHNDGLLCQAVMKSANVDFKKALQMVEEWVEGIRRELDCGSYVLRGVGELFLDDNGNLSFKAYEQVHVSKNSFGLSSFYYPQLSKASEKKLTQISKERVVSSDVSRWLAAASIFIMLLLFSRPTAYNDIQNASVGMSLDTIIEATPHQSKEEAIPESKAEIVSNEKEYSLDDATMPTNVKLVSKALTSKSYHIIIASLSDRSQADLFTLNYCLGTYEDYQILKNGKRHRVSVKVFNSKEEALPFLQKVRDSHPFFKDAWILAVNN